MEDRFPHMIPKHCEVCKKVDGLLRCGACKTYYYCSRAHQVADRPTHKTTCKTIKETKDKIDAEEAKLRARSAGDDGLPPNILEAHGGRLWLWVPARPYLQAMFVHGEMLVRSWRQQGIEDALALYLDVLQKNTTDNQGVRHHIPALYMRLGRNQEAYDFLKAWGLQFMGRPEASAPNDARPAYQRLKNADPTEAVDLWTGQFLDLALASSVLLVKVRLLFGLQLLLEFKEGLPHGAPVPPARDILADVGSKCCDDIFDRMPEEFADVASITKKRDEINGQLEELFVAIGKYNKHFWPMMLYPEERDFSSRSQGFIPGSREEAHLAFTCTYSAWCETPMALQTVRASFTAGEE